MNPIKYLKQLYKKYKKDKAFKKRLAEIEKRDPFTYKNF